jgi:hypothetical protein
LEKDLLAKNNVTTLEHFAYSPDLAQDDFYLFHRLKSESKRRGYCDATDVIRNAMKVLKGLSKNGFHNVPTTLQWLAELYSFTGDWFRGNVPQIECTVL